jgi:hypothetical protein
MATRDLTEHFVRQRSALHRKAPGVSHSDFGGGSGLLASGVGSGMDTAPLALSGASPVYVEMVNEITADMDGLNAKSVFDARIPLRLSRPPPLPLFSPPLCRAPLCFPYTQPWRARPPPPLLHSDAAGRGAQQAHADQL